MEWTTQSPTGPGWYWMWRPGRAPRVVEVTPDHRGHLEVSYAGSEETSWLYPAPWSDVDPGTLWAGPITPPPIRS